jgi:hypothetical protein
LGKEEEGTNQLQDIWGDIWGIYIRRGVCYLLSADRFLCPQNEKGQNEPAEKEGADGQSKEQKFVVPTSTQIFAVDSKENHGGKRRRNRRGMVGRGREGNGRAGIWP